MEKIVNPLWLLSDDAFSLVIRRTGLLRGAKSTNMMLQRVKQLEREGKTRYEIQKLTGLHPRTIRLYLNT